jgi:protein tyrosine phosphatase (PTP) superfamily phosphohydrolase (DUF442 family)
MPAGTPWDDKVGLGIYNVALTTTTEFLKERTVSYLIHAGSRLLAAGVFLLGAAAHAETVPENFLTWRAGLVSSAQPNAEYLAHAKEAGYEVVINLAPRQSQGSLEAESVIVAKQGLSYVNIPVAFSRPTLRDFELFSAAVKGSGVRSVLVHCQANFRGGSFVMLYRVIHENAPAAEQLSKLTSIWAPDPVWTVFINETLKHYGKATEIF